MTEPNQPRPRGHVEATPEARPLPPAWRDQVHGSIPGMPGGAPASAAGDQEARQTAPPGQSQSDQTQAPPQAPPEPHPAFQPDANRPIPLYGDRQERPGGEPRRAAGWEAGDLLKPLAAGAALLAVAGLRLAVRGVSQLADALGSRRRP